MNMKVRSSKAGQCDSVFYLSTFVAIKRQILTNKKKTAEFRTHTSETLPGLWPSLRVPEPRRLVTCDVAKIRRNTAKSFKSSFAPTSQ